MGYYSLIKTSIFCSVYKCLKFSFSLQILNAGKNIIRKPKDEVVVNLFLY